MSPLETGRAFSGVWVDDVSGVSVQQYVLLLVA